MEWRETGRIERKILTFAHKIEQWRKMGIDGFEVEIERAGGHNGIPTVQNLFTVQDRPPASLLRDVARRFG